MGVKYKDYYIILNVKRDASQDDIRKAFRVLAKKYHPDVSDALDANRLYKEINEAYEVLKDPDKRAKYDALGSRLQHGQDFTPPPGAPNGLGGPQMDFSDFSEFFKVYYATSTDFDVKEEEAAPTYSAFTNASGFEIKRDAHVELELSLEELLSDKTQSLVYHSGAQFKPVKLKLPRGVINGSRIRMRGRGPGGGDLFVTLKVQKHDVFELDKYDLICMVRVKPWLAVLGGEVEVKTLDGKVKIKIPAGMQGGKKMRLRGKGLPKRDSAENGDLYARIEIDVPQSVSSQQRRLWEELAALG